MTDLNNRLPNRLPNRFERLFETLAQKSECALVPFVNLCDPTPEVSLAILNTLAEAGADALELGIPFSDPCADSPVVAASAHRALKNGSTTAKCLDVVRQFRATHPDTPVSIVLYINLVFAPDPEKFFAMCADAGVDAVRIPDLPVSMREDGNLFDAAAQKHGIDLVALVPSSMSDDRIKRVAKYAQSYAYVPSDLGCSASESETTSSLTHTFEVLQSQGAGPGLLGLNSSCPKVVAQALKTGAAGVVANSIIVEIVDKHMSDIESMLAEIRSCVQGMKSACRR